MDDDGLEEFDRFLIYDKTAKLLECYGIKPANVSVEVCYSVDGKGILFALTDKTISYPDGITRTITNQEHTERLKYVRAILGIEDSEMDTIVFKDYPELYNKLCAAIEKAPKNFTRFR